MLRGMIWLAIAVSVFALFSVTLAQEAPSTQFRLRVEADAGARDWLSAAGYDIAGYMLGLDRVEVITDQEGMAGLRARGLPFAILELRKAPRPLAQGSHGDSSTDGPLSDTRYHDPAEVEAFLQGVAADHPAITRLVSLGTTHQGRTIWGLMISDNAAVDEDELSVLFNAAHHAREVMTPEIIMDTIDQLTDNYGVDPTLTGYVDSYQIWCVPIVNPDGVARVHEVDDYWRKNARDNDTNGAINSQDGVDLNRNYEWGWGGQCNGSSNAFSSQTYRGPSEGSEPEAKALIGLGRAYRPVFDVEYHSYGEDVFYALSCDPAYSPKLSTISGSDKAIGALIATEYASRLVTASGSTGFHPAPYGSRVDGTGRDQQYHESGSIAFVTEVNTSSEGGFHPDYGVYRDPTVEGQRPGWTYLLERMAGPAVDGTVRDLVSGLPLEAEISLDELSLPDGKRLSSHPVTGRFHLVVVPGDYTLRVTREGYEDALRSVTVGEGAYTPLAIDLQPLGAELLAFEDFEDPVSAALWTPGFPGDTAIDGQWIWGEPEGTFSGSITSNLQFHAARFDRSAGAGVSAFVTGNQATTNPEADDVDGGVTSLVSPAYNAEGYYGVRASWQQWFAKEAADPLDRFDVEVSGDGGVNWLLLDRISEATATADASPAWVGRAGLLDELLPLGADLRFRFRVFDDGAANIVEGALDEFRILGYSLSSDGEVSAVRLTGRESTVVSWNAVPGGAGATYDVVRGELAGLSGDAAAVGLGPLTCIEEDSADTDTADHPDEDSPAPGTGRYYLVRFALGFSAGDWGRGSAGGLRSGDGGCQ